VNLEAGRAGVLENEYNKSALDIQIKYFKNCATDLLSLSFAKEFW
jgi:hypothetical protein